MQYLQTNINTVHTALNDSYWGFKECAAVVPDSLKEKFSKIAMERGRMVRELEVRGGATRSSSGSVTGSLNRTWSKIKASVSSVQHMLDDMGKEEASLKKTYEDALKSSAVDSSLNGLLITHLQTIECDLRDLRIICGEAKYSDKWDIAVPTTGEKFKEKLHTTGETISSKLSSTGETISSKLSSTGTTIKDTFHSTSENISSKFSTSGAAIKDKLGFGQTQNEQPQIVTSTDQHTTTGQNIKDKLQATGTAIKDKLGFGQTENQQTENQQKNMDTTVVNTHIEEQSF
jgi:uncharacterized protein (TIGR02284 family)